jgi:hypothetical protein
LAEPEAATLRLFPLMLQLVPEVPVCPEEDIVKCCAKPVVKNNKMIDKTLKKCAVLFVVPKFFPINYCFNELLIGKNSNYFKKKHNITYGKNTVFYKKILKSASNSMRYKVNKSFI